MKIRNLVLFLIAAVILLAVMPVSADRDAVTAPVIGSWMLDKVFEKDTLLDPESAGSLYSEASNIYAFVADGIAAMTMEELTQYGYWEKQDDGFRMVINSTLSYMHKDSKDASEIDPPYVMDFVYDAEENVLHRYWNDEDPEATYHDLDFVYRRIPQGTWRLTKVYSLESAGDPVLQDPAASQSLYAESVNHLEIIRDRVIEFIPSDDGYIYSYGNLERSGDDWMLKFEDGFEAQMVYDDRAGVLHRKYFGSEVDPTYSDFDFVYEMLPARTWRLQYVYDMDQDAALLDPEKEPELYAETEYSYLFAVDGNAEASIPYRDVRETGKWSLKDGEVLLQFDDGREMVFIYDNMAEVLHRYQKSGDPEQHELDFVFLED